MQKDMLKKLKSNDLKDILKNQNDKKKKTSFMIGALGDSLKPRLSQPDDHDSPTVRAMRLFRLKDPKDYKVRGISDRLDY